MTMVEAVERSVEAALEAGRIDADAQAAPIQALRELAARADVASERDNVTYPTMLKYMQALGMMPETRADESAPRAATRLGAARSRAKYSKLHVA